MSGLASQAQDVRRKYNVEWRSKQPGAVGDWEYEHVAAVRLAIFE